MATSTTNPTISTWTQRLNEAKQVTPVVAKPLDPPRLTDKEELDLLFEKYLVKVKLKGSSTDSDAPIIVQLPMTVDLIRAYQIANRFADYLNQSDPSIWAQVDDFAETECPTYEVRVTQASQPRLVEKFTAHTQVAWQNDKPFEFYCNDGFLKTVEIPLGCGEFTLKYNGRNIAVSVGGKATLQTTEELTAYGQELANVCIGDLHNKVASCKYTFKPTDLGILGSRLTDRFSLHFHAATPNASIFDEHVTVLLRVLALTVCSTGSLSRTVRGCQDGC